MYLFGRSSDKSVGETLANPTALRSLLRFTFDSI